jgi:hypothetical protein
MAGVCFNRVNLRRSPRADLDFRIKVMAVTPAQMGFPHVLQLARLDRIRELQRGQQEVQAVWVITSLSSEQAGVARLREVSRL